MPKWLIFWAHMTHQNLSGNIAPEYLWLQSVSLSTWHSSWLRLLQCVTVCQGAIFKYCEGPSPTYLISDHCSIKLIQYHPLHPRYFLCFLLSKFKGL